MIYAHNIPHRAHSEWYREQSNALYDLIARYHGGYTAPRRLYTSCMVLQRVFD